MENDKVEIARDDFYETIKAMYGKYYTYDELKKEYNIESKVRGGILCSLKEDEDELIMFLELKTPDNREVYIPAQ